MIKIGTLIRTVVEVQGTRPERYSTGWTQVWEAKEIPKGSLGVVLDISEKTVLGDPVSQSIPTVDYLIRFQSTGVRWWLTAEELECVKISI